MAEEISPTAEIYKNRGIYDWQKEKKKAPREGAEEEQAAADDNHRQVIDRHRQLEHLVIGDAERVAVEHASDPGVEGRDRERPELVAEDVDADDLGGDVLVAHGDEGAANAAAHQV